MVVPGEEELLVLDLEEHQLEEVVQHPLQGEEPRVLEAVELLAERLLHHLVVRPQSLAL